MIACCIVIIAIAKIEIKVGKSMNGKINQVAFEQNAPPQVWCPNVGIGDFWDAIR